jgi:hypothetical protein
MFSALNNNKIMLPPKAFVRIVVDKPEGEIPGLDELPRALRNVFSDLQATGNVDELLSDGSYMPGAGYPGIAAEDRAHELKESLSLEAEPVRKRIVIIAIRGGKGPESNKEASLQAPQASARVLAKEYAKYQLSFLAGAESDEYVKLAALQNQLVT